MHTKYAWVCFYTNWYGRYAAITQVDSNLVGNDSFLMVHGNQEAKAAFC